MKVANDAPSRNAFNKLHAALTKVIGEAGTTKKSLEEESVVDVARNESIMIQKADVVDNMDVKMEDALNETGTKMEGSQGKADAQDSLLEELLDDEDMEL